MTMRFRQQRFVEVVLGNAGLFAGVPQGEILALARQSWIVGARRGDMLVRGGEVLPGVFVVGYGQAKLALRTSPARERVLRIVSAGQSFGAAAMLLGRASAYEASALVDAKLVVVPAAPICGLMEREPRFAHSLSRALAERVLELCEELEALSLQSGGQRLASYLGSLAQPVNGHGGWAARLPISKTLVAARLSMNKETLSRLLRRLAAEGMIEVSRSEIVIRDRDALARLASDFSAP
jgi:CRP/FNR family transcriptional regulator, dissimilatory nitrate respiration regulator